METKVTKYNQVENSHEPLIGNDYFRPMSWEGGKEEKMFYE